MARIEKKEDKLSKLATYIANLQEGVEKVPTELGDDIDVHPDTGRGLLDIYETLQDSGKIMITRDETGKIMRFVKLRDDTSEIESRAEVRDLLRHISNRLDNFEKQIKLLKTRIK